MPPTWPRAASKFLLQLHQLSDDLKKKYASSYDQLRQSPELSNLISESNSAPGNIDFSEKEMEIRGGILGLERRATEKRKNRAPLQEVADLSENSFSPVRFANLEMATSFFFWTRRPKKAPGPLPTPHFLSFTVNMPLNSRRMRLPSWPTGPWPGCKATRMVPCPEIGLKVEVEGKDSRLLRGYYDSLTGRIDSQLEKLEERGN